MRSGASGARSRAIAFIAAVAWYPLFLALPWELDFVTTYDLGLVSAYRSLAVLAIIAVGTAVLVRLVVPRTPIAGALACLIVVALLKASSVAQVAAFVLAAILLLIEYRMELQGRLHLPWSRIHEALTAIALVLLIVQVANYGLAVARRPSVTFDPAWDASVAPPDHPPNLYVVIADGHPRADVSRDGYGYDPSGFLAGLERIGFVVADRSRANYLHTELSLPSFYSGSQLSQLGLDPGAPPDRAILASALRDNPTARLLRRIGYQVVGIPSGYDHVQERNVDRDLDTGQLSALEYRLIESSQLNVWVPDQIDGLWLAALRERTVASLGRLEDVAAQSGGPPRAVFVHLPLPHPPLAFDEQCGSRPVDRFTFPGDPLDAAGLQEAAMIEGRQTRCIDRLLAPSLAAVVAADPSAIVILISDHGPDTRFDWRAPAQPGISERAACLFAARTPGFDGLFPDDVTLVNVLPTLFNAYLGMALPIRSDNVYVAMPEANGALRPVASP